MPDAFQRALGPTKPFTNEFGTLDMPELVPMPYRGHRKINPRSRGSNRVFPVWLDPETARARVFGCDSQLEYHHLALILTNPKTAQVHEQYGPISFVDADGHRRTHYIDLLITQKSGQKIAVAVKPTERLKSGAFLRDLHSLESSIVPRIADEVRLVTERCFSRGDAFNAAMYQRFKLHTDAAVEARFQDVLASTAGETTICDIARRCRAGGRAFRVIVKAIFEGKLEKQSHGRIDLFTKVLRTS